MKNGWHHKTCSGILEITISMCFFYMMVFSVRHFCFHSKRSLDRETIFVQEIFLLLVKTIEKLRKNVPNDSSAKDIVQRKERQLYCRADLKWNKNVTLRRQRENKWKHDLATMTRYQQSKRFSEENELEHLFSFSLFKKSQHKIQYLRWKLRKGLSFFTISQRVFCISKILMLIIFWFKCRKHSFSNDVRRYH